MTHTGYEANGKLLVLSADVLTHTVSPDVQIDHVTRTKIYGDGRVVFIDPAKGDDQIFEGKLDEQAIARLFDLLRRRGFFGFADHYVKPTPGGATQVITATPRDASTKCVVCDGPGAAPEGFAECLAALLYPGIQPTAVRSYVRASISRTELHQGWYWGDEYQKKLKTPPSWTWIDAGKSSKWSQPVAHTVTLDSSFMTTPVANCRHVRVQYSGTPASAGSTIQFDRNGMSPDQFGDIGLSTKMYFSSQPATCTLLDERGDERLFSLGVSGYTGTSLRLVILGDLARPTGGRLLEIDAHNAIQNIHWLQPAPAPPEVVA